MPRGTPIRYTEEDLAQAVTRCESWRGVMKCLGYSTTNGYLSERLRREAERMGLNTFHFKHSRHRTTWTNEQVDAAVRSSATWVEVLRALDGPVNSYTLAKVKGRAARLGLDRGHLASKWAVSTEVPFTCEPDVKYLPTAGPTIAAAWFMRRGYAVSYPAEARPYDLVVEAVGRLWRVQVKTTVYTEPRSGAQVCRIGRVPARNGKQMVYDVDEVDFFFIVVGDGACYLIPIEEVGGALMVTLGMVAHRLVSQ